MKQYAADFETTTQPDDCRVWTWGIVDIDNIDTFLWGCDIAGFIEHALNNPGVYHFHNLRFDGISILDYLLKHGYKHAEKLTPNTFTSLISDTGQFYKISIMDRRRRVFHCQDSLKKLPMSVDAVSKAFNMNVRKGSIDYEAPRPIGYTPTRDELEYLRADCEIVARALHTQHGQDLTRLTVGSDALAHFTTKNPYYRDFFPVIDVIADSDIRLAYRGGWTHVNAKYRNMIIDTPGQVLDVNSMYPYIMCERDLPCGNPVFWEDTIPNDPQYPLWIVQVTAEFTLKPGYLPTIQVKGNALYNSVEYVTETSEPTTLFLTNVDYELLHKHYDIHSEYIHNGYKFRSCRGVFDDYIREWVEVKQQSTGGLRTIAKLMLNSLYGKFATNPTVTGRIPQLEDNRVRLVLGDETIREPVYTPVGIFITSWARDHIIRTAQSLGERFIYADTDSLHILGTDNDHGIDTHPTRLGAWKQENTFTRARYVRPKCYVEECSVELPLLNVCENQQVGRIISRIAGLPERARDGVTVDTLEPGATFQGKLRPKIVPGGVVLLDTPFTVKV